MVETAILHPAARRRIERMMPPEPHHDVVLRPLGAGDARTIIATSSAQDFIEGLFETLAAADWNNQLAAMRGLRRGKDGLLELGLPIHRRFQIALFEAICHQPGSPRLDPAKISSQGMVIRRIRGGRWAGWMKSGRKISGWLPLAGENVDPDPRKRGAAPAGNRQARALIARRNPPAAMAEDVLGLYVAPRHLRGAGRIYCSAWCGWRATPASTGPPTRSTMPPCPANRATTWSAIFRNI